MSDGQSLVSLAACDIMFLGVFLLDTIVIQGHEPIFDAESSE